MHVFFQFLTVMAENYHHFNTMSFSILFFIFIDVYLSLAMQNSGSKISTKVISISNLDLCILRSRKYIFWWTALSNFRKTHSLSPKLLIAESKGIVCSFSQSKFVLSWLIVFINTIGVLKQSDMIEGLSTSLTWNFLFESVNFISYGFPFVF